MNTVLTEKLAEVKIFQEKLAYMQDLQKFLQKHPRFVSELRDNLDEEPTTQPYDAVFREGKRKIVETFLNLNFNEIFVSCSTNIQRLTKEIEGLQSGSLNPNDVGSTTQAEPYEMPGIPSNPPL